MLRHVLVLVLCALSGCLLATSAAMGIRFFGGAIPGPDARDLVSDQSSRAYTRVGTFRSIVRFDRAGDDPWVFVRPWWLTFDPDKYNHCNRLVLHAAGWPLPCLYSVQGVHFMPPRGDGQPEFSGFLSVSVGRRMRGEIPYLVLPRGLAVNATVFSTIIFLFRLVTVQSLRWYRVRRGLCHKCGYAVGRFLICSECGTKQGPRTIADDRFKSLS